ncbi:hypothetical protein CR513_57970, partial [Mucuna pruriens]
MRVPLKKWWASIAHSQRLSRLSDQIHNGCLRLLNDRSGGPTGSRTLEYTCVLPDHCIFSTDTGYVDATSKLQIYAYHDLACVNYSICSSRNLSQIDIGSTSLSSRLRWSATTFSAPFLSLNSTSKGANLFAWQLFDMLRIDPNFLCHHLALCPEAKPIAQKKQKTEGHQRVAIKHTITKLKIPSPQLLGHIFKIQSDKDVSPEQEEDYVHDRRTELLLSGDVIRPKECRSHILEADGQSFRQPYRSESRSICGRYGDQIH